ncbi:MAG: NAD-dependent epimerase/dehydratase family protein [Synergistaceae bacterium]|jgi:UDP-glucose 4-epimerase|nr:NAD-dependent epimerase/dehydratase family protein [Synergistaceae bacterium]
MPLQQDSCYEEKSEGFLYMCVVVVGGAGFIGSHVTKRLLKENIADYVKVYDNFSSGTESHLSEIMGDSRLSVVRGDVKDIEYLTEAFVSADQVWHFASNPDIAKAMSQPDVDFWEGTYLTNNVLEAIRRTSVKELIYASGSGVYGETGHLATGENYSPMRPTSTYGASKLAGEALICAYCHMFDLNARAYRFANVVGPKQTHGVGFDFVRRLRENPEKLKILGDGRQSKSYIHVEDVIDAILTSGNHAQKPFDVFNVATGDYITVKEIADLALEVMNLSKNRVFYEYAGGDRGWKGDVPIVRFDLSKIHITGWKSKLNSKEALRSAMLAMREEL